MYVTIGTDLPLEGTIELQEAVLCGRLRVVGRELEAPA